MVALVLCLALASADARPTVAIVPPSPVTAAGRWLGMALADNLTNRLLVHSRFDPKNLQRDYPLNVFGWRQSLSAARGEGVALADLGSKHAVLREQLGADFVFVGSYEVGATTAKLKWFIHSDTTTKSGVLQMELAGLSEAADKLALQLLEAVGQKPQNLGGHKLERLPVAAVKPYGEALELLGQQSLDPRANLVLPRQDMARAHALLTAATDAAPTFVRAWVERGVASTMLGELARAEEEFVASMAHAGEFEPATSLGLYYLYDRQDKADQGLKVLEEATSTHLGFLQGLGYLGEAYARQSRGHEALSTFSTYAARVPKSPWAQVKRAAALSRIGQHDQAIADTQAVLTRMPGSMMVLLALASRQIDARQYDAARLTLERAQKLHPGHPAVLTRLSYIQLEQNKPAEALVYAEKAVQALGDGRGEPLAGYAHLNLGHALALLGKKLEAFAALDKALHLGVGADELIYLKRDARLRDLLNDPRCPLRPGHRHDHP